MAKATTKKTNGNGNGSHAQSFETQVTSVTTSMNALLIAVKRLGLPVLTDEQRNHTMGKLRVGEAAAITAILDTADANPALFESLADKDGGTDPAVLETQPARAGLSQAEYLSPLMAVLVQFQQIVSDGMMSGGETAKQLSVPAYAIGKVLSTTNAKVRTSMAPALTFYGAKQRQVAAAKKRVVTAAKKAAKNAKKTASAAD